MVSTFDVHVFRSSKREAATEFCKRDHIDIHSRYHSAGDDLQLHEAARMKTVLAGMIKWASRGQTYLVVDESIQTQEQQERANQSGPSACRLEPIHRRALNVRFLVRILTGRPQTHKVRKIFGVNCAPSALFRHKNYYAFRGDSLRHGRLEGEASRRRQEPKINSRPIWRWWYSKRKRRIGSRLCPTKRMTIGEIMRCPASKKRQYASMEEESSTRN